MNSAQRVAVFREAGREATYRPGDVLLHEGAPGDHCVAIVSGQVLVTTSSSAGATIVLGRRGPGDIVGELSLLDGSPRSARVIANDRVQARRLTKAELERLFTGDPDFALAEIRRLGAEVRSLSRRITGRSEELRVRVLDLLTIHAEATGERVFRSTREELAGWVGATREAVTRTLADLATDGVVTLGRGQVALVD